MVALEYDDLQNLLGMTLKTLYSGPYFQMMFSLKQCLNGDLNNR